MTRSACQPAPIDIERRGMARAPAFGSRLHRPATVFVGHGEPALTDLLDDPIFGRLLASDGVHRDDLATLLAQVRLNLSRR